MKRLNDYRMKLMLVGIVAAITFCGGSAEADFTFGDPTSLGPTVNSPNTDHSADTSVDGLSLFFVSDRPGGHGLQDLWMATRATRFEPWCKPVNMGSTVNSSFSENKPCISSDGLSLFFQSDRPGGYGSEDIWVATRPTPNDSWNEPVNLGPIVNSPAQENGLSISADGLSLYFSTFYGPRPNGLGGDDIWLTRRVSISDPWDEPINIGPPINTPYNDFLPYMSHDGLLLFFNSFRPRPAGLGDPPAVVGDAYMAHRRTPEDPWEEPRNLSLIMGGFTTADLRLSIDGSTLYCNFLSPGTGLDLWQVPILAIVDLNGDGIVDSTDMCIIVDHWGTDNSLCDIGPMPWGDGVVDVQDLIVLAEHLFEEIPPTESVE